MNEKISFLIQVFIGLLNSYFWVFAAFYVRKGVEYTRLKSSDAIDNSIIVAFCCFILLFQAYNGTALFLVFLNYPVFKPTDGLTP